MRVLWTIVKVVLALALAIPVAIIVLSTAMGLLGALVGLAMMTLRLAIVGLVVYGLFRIGAALFGGRREPSAVMPIRELSRPDPYYEAAKRELDEHMGEVR